MCLWTEIDQISSSSETWVDKGQTGFARGYLLQTRLIVSELMAAHPVVKHMHGYWLKTKQSSETVPWLSLENGEQIRFVKFWEKLFGKST